MTNIPVSERTQWIGASESAALFSLSPYVTPFGLWQQKMGLIPSPDLSDDERVMAGQFMEPSIAAWASKKWHWPIQPITEYREHPTVAKMGCSLDFETVEGHEPVEIKNVDNLVFREGDWAHEGDVILDAPNYHLLQVQHQIACGNRGEFAPRGWLIACVGGNKLLRMEIERHDPMIAKIELAVDDFWASVASGKSPDPNYEVDAATISLLYGGTGSDFMDLRGNVRARDLCQDYLDALADENDAKAIKRSSLAELKVMMEDCRGALIDDGYGIKAAHLKESTSVRKPHWRFSVRQKKESSK